MASIGTRLLTWWKGEFVGTDEFGNRYYTERGKQYRSWRRRRWVVYDGEVEASRVPAGRAAPHGARGGCDWTGPDSAHRLSALVALHALDSVGVWSVVGRERRTSGI